MKHQRTHNMKGKPKPYFNNLDGLRGIAMILVVLHHCPLGFDVLDILTRNARFGVDLFFIISGFLICTLFLHEQKKTGAVDLPRFFVRRITRLFPLYYLALGLYCVLIFGFELFNADNRELFAQKLPSYILYYSNMLTVGAIGPFFFAWSLAVEEQFYTIFGTMIWALKRTKILVVLTVALLMKIAYYNGLMPGLKMSYQWELIVFSYREPIILGVMLAYAMYNTRIREFFQRYLCHPWLCTALTVLWVAILAIHRMDHRSLWSAQIFYVFSTLLIACAAFSAPAPLLRVRPIMHLGTICYGIYLFHMLYINTLFKIFDSPVLVFTLTIAIGYVVNSIIYHYFEKPMMFRGRHIYRAMQARRAVAPSKVKRD